MESPGPVAKLAHLPQDGDAAAWGGIAQEVEHGFGGVRVGVVAIVPDRDAVVGEALGAHPGQFDRVSGFAELAEGDTPEAGDSDAGGNVEDADASGDFGLEGLAVDFEAGAIE